jgi:hypothetical protein
MRAPAAEVAGSADASVLQHKPPSAGFDPLSRMLQALETLTARAYQVTPKRCASAHLHNYGAYIIIPGAGFVKEL